MFCCSFATPHNYFVRLCLHNNYTRLHPKFYPEFPEIFSLSYAICFGFSGYSFFRDKVGYPEFRITNLSATPAAVYRSLIRGVLSFLSSQESLKPSDLAILSLKTFPDCLVLKRGTASRKSLTRFANWGIAYAGAVLTAKTSESDSPDDGCSLLDILESEVPSKYWLSERSTRKISGC